MAKTAQEKADLKAEKLYEKTHKNRYRTSVGDQIFNVINYVVYTLFTIICIFPFYYLFINTISDNDLVVKGLINFIPRGIHFGNYAALLNVSDLMSSFIVSVTRTVFGTALMVAASAFIGYLVTQQEMWGRKVWYRFIVITMYFNAGLIPWFLNMQMLGLTNTYWAYIIPGIVAPYNIILVKTYIESIPNELEESAKIDGASKLKQITAITLPLLRPTIIIMTLMAIGRVFYSDFGLFYQVPMNAGTLFSTTQTIDTYVYRGLMEQGNVGMSSAAGVYQSLVGFALVMIANFIVRKKDPENALF